MNSTPKLAESDDVDVIGCSLMPDQAAGLKKALQSAVERNARPSDAELQAIMAKHLPPLTLAPSQNIYSEKPTLFVLHNAPELTRDEYQETRGHSHTHTLNPPGYSALIAKGMQLHVGSKPISRGTLITRSGMEANSVTRSLHKDGPKISTFSTIFNDQKAPTRFTNWDALLEDVQRDPETYSDLIMRGNQNKSAPLPNFTELRSDWRTSNGGAFVLTSEATMEQRERFEDLVARHSRDVILGAGDIAIWDNGGAMIHSSRDGTFMPNYTGVSRANVLDFGG